MRCLMVHNASLALHENEKHIKVSCRCKAQFCQNSECKSRIWFLCPFLISYTNWHNHSLAPSRGRKKKDNNIFKDFSLCYWSLGGKLQNDDVGSTCKYCENDSNELELNQHYKRKLNTRQLENQEFSLKSFSIIFAGPQKPQQLTTLKVT